MRPVRLEPRVLAALGLAGLVACVGLFVDSRPLDLDVYLTAGRGVWHGYDLYGPNVHVRQYGFTYPPFAALLFAPLATLPFLLALVVATAISLGCLAVVIRLSAPQLVARLRPVAATPAVLAVVAMIACEPVRATIWDGQINLVLIAMVLWDLLSPRTGRWRGMLVGVAAAIKLTPAIFVLYLLARRRWRDAGNAVAGFVIVTAIAWAALPHDSSRFWLHKLYSDSGIGDETRASNILGGLLRIMPRSVAFPLWAVCALATVVLGVTMASRVAGSGREAFALGITGVVGCLVSPVTWTHHWVWCIPWLVGVGTVCLERGRAGRRWLGGLIFVYLALNLVPSKITEKWVVSDFVCANALALTALLTAAVYRVGQRATTADPSETRAAQIAARQSRSLMDGPG